jgi:hypothetical protein
MRTRKMKRGVTVGEVVRTVREMLAVYGVEDVKRVCKDLQIMGCGMCQDLYDDAVGSRLAVMRARILLRRKTTRRRWMRLDGVVGRRVQCRLQYVSL